MNEAFDKLNERIGALEAWLAEAKVGVEARATGGDTTIAYKRVNRAWRIGLMDGETFRPWEECSRIDKLRLADVLPALLVSLTDAADDLRRRSDSASYMLAGLEPPNLSNSEKVK